MEQRDYLKRQIDQLGRVLGYILAKIIGFKEIGQVNEGIQFVYQATVNELDINIDFLLDIDENLFLDYLKNDLNFNNSNLEKLSDIFTQLAEMHSLQEKVMLSSKLYKRAKIILEFLNSNNNEFSFILFNKIETIKNRMNKNQ